MRKAHSGKLLQLSLVYEVLGRCQISWHLSRVENRTMSTYAVEDAQKRKTKLKELYVCDLCVLLETLTVRARKSLIYLRKIDTRQG